MEINARSKTGSKIGSQPQLKCNETSDSEDNLTLLNTLAITVTVVAIENLDACKVKDIMVKIEFAGEMLAQTEKLKVLNKSVDVNLNGVIQTDEIDVKFINTLLENPVLFTVYDCSLSTMTPVATDKDAKKKTAKTTASRASLVPVSFPPTILGICNLDIGILTEKKRIRETILLEFEKSLLGQNSVTWNKLPRLIAVASVENGDCLLKYLNDTNNVVGITIESMYNPPEHITEGAVFDATVMMPDTGNLENTIIFPSGLATSTRDPNAKKKWCTLQQIGQSPGGRTSQEISDSSHDIISSLSGDVNLEREINKGGLRVEWNSWKRCFLSRSDSNCLSSKLMKYHVWPVEIISANKTNDQKLAKFDKKLKPAPEMVSNSDHFMAFLNFSPLLYPGIKKVRAAGPLLTYSQLELASKFGIEFPISSCQGSLATVSKNKAVSEKSKTSAKESEDKKEESRGLPVTNKDGLETFIVVEIELWKPLTRRKSPEFIEKDLKSYISLKGSIPQKVINLTIARDSFFKAIQKFIGTITQEYANFMECEQNEYKEGEAENSNAAFHKYLECQEDFNTVVRCLESKVLAFVREKHGDLSQYNEKIPDIYAGLIEEMHHITNHGDFDSHYLHKTMNVMGINRQVFAEEAAEGNDLERAKRYLLQNIAKYKTNPDYWLDYAVFCIRLEDYEKALEAIREALSLDVCSWPGLLLYGSLMAVLKNGTIGENAFQFLTAKYPDFIEGWKAFHFFYQIFDNFQGAEVTSQMSLTLEYERRKKENSDIKKNAKKSDKFECMHFDSTEATRIGQAFLGGLSRREPLAWTTSLCPPENVNLRTTVLMLRLGLHEFASMALAEELLRNPGTVCPYYQYYLSVNYYLQGRYEEAIRQLEIGVQEFGKDCYLWSLMGHCYYRLEDHDNAFACYEYVMEYYNRPEDIHLIYLRMGSYYLEKKKLVCAKHVFATGCKHSPSPDMWKGAGIALLLLNEYEEAEVAFGEANYLDNEDPDTWAYLALVNGHLRRHHMLTHCYLEAQKRMLKNKNLVHEIEQCISLNRLELN